MRLREVFERVSGMRVQHEVTGVSTDTRTLKRGEAFIALKGERFDGNQFAEEALKKGASVVVTKRKDVMASDFKATLITVKDPLKFMCELARVYRNSKDWKVIGITGSAGKTSLKELTRNLLGERFIVHSAVKSYNNFIGLSLTLLNAPLRTEYVIVELGTNAPGEIKALTRIASPDVGIITSVGPSHLEGLGTIENVADEKLDLFRGMKKRSKKLANGDVPILKKKAREDDIQPVWFGQKRSNQIVLKTVCIRREGLSFTFDGPLGRFDGEIRGIYHSAAAVSAMPAVHLALEAGVPVNDVRRALQNFRPVEGRGVLKKVKRGLFVYDDSYNANPISFRAAAEAVRNIVKLFNLSSAVAVVGDMLELGRTSMMYHRTVFHYLLRSGFKRIFATGEFWGRLCHQVNSKVLSCYTSSEDAGKACAEYVRKLFKAGGVCVMVKGSRRMQMEKAVKCLVEG